MAGCTHHLQDAVVMTAVEMLTLLTHRTAVCADHALAAKVDLVQCDQS